MRCMTWVGSIGGTCSQLLPSELRAIARHRTSLVVAQLSVPEGHRAFLQAKRQADVVAPEVREQFRRQQARK